MKIKSWIKAARLRTLPLSLSGIIAGSFAAYTWGYWDTTIFTLAMLTTLFLQVLSNFANDLGDSYKGADNANRVGPPRAVQSGEISKNQMKTAVIIFSVLALATAVPLILIGTQGMPSPVLWTYIFLALSCVLAAITYTVGKKAYGYHGMGDLMVFIFFGLVSVLGVYTLYTKRFDLPVLALALVIGFLSVAVLNLNNMRDHINDKAVGKKTMVVMLGFKNAKIYHTALILLAFFSLLSYVMWTAIFTNPICLIPLIPFFFLFKHLFFVWKVDEPRKLDQELKKVALSTFFIAVLYSISTLL